MQVAFDFSCVCIHVLVYFLFFLIVATLWLAFGLLTKHVSCKLFAYLLGIPYVQYN
jgi:hypothetical protein